jgi:hypothetical protein
MDLGFILDLADSLGRLREATDVFPVLSGAHARVAEGNWDVVLVSTIRFNYAWSIPVVAQGRKVIMYNGETPRELARRVEQMTSTRSPLAAKALQACRLLFRRMAS